MKSTLSLAGRKVQRGPIGVYTTPRRAREGPGTSSYTFVPSHAFNACQRLRSRSSHLYRRPPACPAWETTLVGVQILWGRWGQCLTQVCPTQTRVRSLGQTRHDGVQWLANEMMAISSGALCKAHTLHKRQQHGLWQNFLSHPTTHAPPDEMMMACFALQLPSP